MMFQGQSAAKKYLTDRQYNDLQKRRGQISDLRDFYLGDTLKHLRKNPDELDQRWFERPKESANYTAPVLDAKSSVTYKGSVYRSVDDAYKDLFDRVWQENQINRLMRQVDQDGLLTGITALRPIAVPDPLRPGRMTLKYRLYTGNQIVARFDDDSGELIELNICYESRDAKGKRAEFFQRWTADVLLDTDMETGRVTEMENPYSRWGLIPFALFWEQRTTDNPHGDFPMLNVTDINQAINTLLTDLAWLAKTQAHGQFVAKNLPKTQRITIGPGVVAYINGQEASLELLNADPKIAALLDMIAAKRASIFEVSRVPEAAINPQATQSGLSRIIQLSPLLEYREEKIIDYTAYEADLARVTAAVANAEGIQAIPNPDDIGFQISFDEAPLAVMRQMREEQEEKDLANNVISYTDLIMARNPGMTEEEALEKLAANKALNDQYREQEQAQGGIFGGVI